MQTILKRYERENNERFANNKNQSEVKKRCMFITKRDYRLCKPKKVGFSSKITRLPVILVTTDQEKLLTECTWFIN